jgi:lysophospholipase L1-like esterase
MRLMLLAILGVIGRALLRARRLPANRPARFRGRGAVVCLGASTVQGNVSFNFVDELARRLPDRVFVNAGINGETSAQALARVPEVKACQPTDVIVMVGANDLAAIRGSKLAAGKHTTFDEYRTNLTAIVRGLRPARVALMSIQPLGERLESPENQDMDRLNAVVRAVATAEDAVYLPFNERMKDLVRGGDRAVADSPLRVLLAIVLRLGVGVSLDHIGRLFGFRAHTEGLHLASPAGLLAADLAEEFLETVPTQVDSEPM